MQAVLAENFASCSPIYDAQPEERMRERAGEADVAVEEQDAPGGPFADDRAPEASW